MRAMEDHYHGGGEEEVKYLLYGYVFPAAPPLVKYTWVKKTLNKKSNVTRTDDIGARILSVLEWAGFLDGRFGN